jgi:fumarate reductase subunit D
MKRSHEPLFWALFGAGGMLSALLAPALVVVTGIALPLGWLPASAWGHAEWLAALQHPLARLALLAVVALFLFHGGHRIRHSLHDLGLPGGAWMRLAGIACYGLAMAGSALAAWWLLRL